VLGGHSTQLVGQLGIGVEPALAPGSPRTLRAASALRSATLVFGLATMVAALWGRPWLGVRAWIVVLLTGLALASAGRRPAGRSGARLAALSAGIAALVTAPEVTRAEASLVDRVLGRDLPPLSVYTAWGASLLLTAACVGLALSWRARRSPLEAPAQPREGIRGGLIGAALLVVVLVAVSALARSMADGVSLIDAGAAEMISRDGARRLPLGPGPANPTQLAWHVELDPGLDVRQVATVPGWDVVLVLGDRPGSAGGSLVARSVRDGEEQWRFEPRDDAISGVGVDPEAGRVLILAVEVAVVLDLEDGTVETAQGLPGPAGDLGWRLMGGRFGREREIAVGAQVVVQGRGAGLAPVWDGVAVLEVATGEVVATSPIAGEGCRYAAMTTSSRPVVAAHGSSDDPECPGLSLLTPDGAGALTRAATVDPPEGQSFVPTGDILLAGNDEMTVLAASLQLETGVGTEVLALAGDEVRWRTPIAPPEDGDGQPFVADRLTVTEAAVLARTRNEWHLLSLADGQPLAHAVADGAEQAISRDDPTVAVDGERIYGARGGRLVVRRLGDLTGLGQWVEYVNPGSAGSVVVASGIVVVHSSDGGTLTGFVEGDPLQPL
jgi:hypothetical protein